jgi:hypothetical protein
VAAGACVLGSLAGRGLERLAEHNDVVYFHHQFPLATAGDAVSNVRLLLEDVALFVHGRLGGFPSPFGITVELVALVAMVAVPVLCVLAARRGLPLLRDSDRPPAQRLLAIYWGIAVAAVSVAFISSSAPEDITAVRYMTILWPALLTLAVIVWRAQSLIWLAALAAATAVLGCVELARDGYADGDPRSPRGREVSQLERFAARNGLDHGYGQYWDAAAITDETDFETRVYPIQRCGPGGGERCQFPFHTIGNWYAPKQGVRTFYLADDGGLPDPVGPPPASWGRPAQRARFGHLTVYVYDYDLATRLGPPAKA